MLTAQHAKEHWTSRQAYANTEMTTIPRIKRSMMEVILHSLMTVVNQFGGPMERAGLTNPPTIVQTNLDNPSCFTTCHGFGRHPTTKCRTAITLPTIWDRKHHLFRRTVPLTNGYQYRLHIIKEPSSRKPRESNQF